MINVDSTIHASNVRREIASADAVLSARRAAEILGVKRETLYAYASRGLLRRARAGEGHGAGYFRSDVERLKARSAARSGHGPVAAGALRWGEPVLESAITSIDRRGPAYRGYVAVELAQAGKTFEQVAELLWSGTLPASTAPWRPAPLPTDAAEIEALVRRAHPVARLAVVVPWLALALAGGKKARSEAATARGLLARMASPFESAAPPSIARAAAATLGAKRVEVEALNLALVVIADHELNVSSFAARVAASAGASLHASISAALGALSGTLHGGECDRVEQLARVARNPAGAARLVRERVKRNEAIAGFGHPLYPAGDPRTAPLLEAARAIAPRALGTLDAIIGAVGGELGLEPTVDFGLVALARALSMRAGGAAGLFALGRAAGWVAHIFEQRSAGYLLRPRARYVGARVAESAVLPKSPTFSPEK